MSNMKNIIPGGDKLLSILEALAEGPRSQQELTAHCRTSPSTCYRALQTLLSHGWVYRNEEGLYDISATLGLLAQRCSENRLKSLMPYLEELSRKTGMTAKISVREGDSQLTFLRAESPLPFGVSTRQGARFPLAEGTVGAALLCDSPATEVRRLCRQCPVELEEHSFSTVQERIGQMNQQGWLFSGRLTRWNVFAMSTPLRVNGKVIAALTLLGAESDFRATEDIADGLCQTAHRMEDLL